MSVRFGMDLDLAKLSPDDKAVCAGAISAYKRTRDVTQLGDLYRLESPHDDAVRGALNYVAKDRARAVVFVFQLKDGTALPVRPQGLDPAAEYVIHELNPAPGRPKLSQEGGIFTGDELMRNGLAPSCGHALEACVIELARKAD
jgi:alpha-galactosidase